MKYNRDDEFGDVCRDFEEMRKYLKDSVKQRLEVHGRIESVLNPTLGIIRADSIGELIMEKDRVHAEDTQIICQTIEKTSDKFQA